MKENIEDDKIYAMWHVPHHISNYVDTNCHSVIGCCFGIVCSVFCCAALLLVEGGGVSQSKWTKGSMRSANSNKN